ncbi:uncharacterized protein N7506_004249 [Penicillium brevicompactum]|uniref:uncharacterized protein n=1 Tax=Penicillium brevicompactum TaxID=5074 RepID=UPI002540532C|nr:uncharacterized protein N7506_004249 [Penicillium brevicompactum]KAJ5336227.1 hypothetical protein N7506_004249 [Penicillium brevicompactum]
MEHYRDSNVLLCLNASRRIEFEADPEVIKMNEKIRALTQEIDRKIHFVRTEGKTTTESPRETGVGMVVIIL